MLSKGPDPPAGTGQAGTCSPVTCHPGTCHPCSKLGLLPGTGTSALGKPGIVWGHTAFLLINCSSAGWDNVIISTAIGVSVWGREKRVCEGAKSLENLVLHGTAASEVTPSDRAHQQPPPPSAWEAIAPVGDFKITFSWQAPNILYFTPWARAAQSSASHQLLRPTVCCFWFPAVRVKLEFQLFVITGGFPAD